MKYITFNSQEELENYASDNGLYYVPEEFDPWEEGKEYEIVDMIDPENSERIITAIVDKEDSNYYEAQRELKIMRNEETLASWFMSYLENDQKLTEKEINRYNNYVATINPEMDGLLDYLDSSYSISQMIRTIEQNSDRV